jgi:curved DNA-binding protein CbpA
MPEESLYELLQVEPSAELSEIRTAYRRLILQRHPGRNPGADAQEMTQRLNQAYATLRDPARRAAYDWRLSGEPGYPPGWEGQPRAETPASSGVGFLKGLPRTAWLAGIGAVVVAATIVVVVVATGDGDSKSADNAVQVIAPAATPDVTPPISPGPTGSAQGSTSSGPTATPSPAFSFESGEAFIRNGDFQRAIEEFSDAIDLLPGYGYGYQIRGDAYFQLA